MAEKSDIPRASASLRSITPMVRITGRPGVDSARMRPWTPVMLVPPRKREGSRCGVMDHASAHTVPRPEPILTQEIQWDQEVHDDPAGRKSGGADRCALCEAPAPSHRRRVGA